MKPIFDKIGTLLGLPGETAFARFSAFYRLLPGDTVYLAEGNGLMAYKITAMTEANPLDGTKKQGQYYAELVKIPKGPFHEEKADHNGVYLSEKNLHIIKAGELKGILGDHGTGNLA